MRPTQRSKKSSQTNFTPALRPYDPLEDRIYGDGMRVQSEETATDSTTEEIVVAENITFRDGALSERITMGDLTSGDYDADSDSIGGLANFLSRPVRIHNFTWQESTFYSAGVNPWQLYFSNPQIKKKLDNYARIRCKLHLKFVLNASPFYYGSLRACYFPLQDARSVYNSAGDQLPFSQVPGVYLEPQNMSTAEMTLPFLYPHNWLDATTSANFVNMGYLHFLQYANLRSANGVSGAGINVSVYAWAEEVELMGPTSSLALQSDEYEEADGTISAPATALADVAGRLTDVPVIAPFAMATQVGASAVASIAKLFGYSNPPLINDVLPYQPKAFHAFANTETRMPIDKLALDPKNEVTISPKVTGVDEPDPLAFDNLLSRESFLIGTLWSGTTAVDTLLWSAKVTPCYTVSSGSFYTTPAAAYVSTMFRYWRGTMVYKFRFIKTKYHKGRLIISWDPTGANVASADVETTTLTRIVDLELEDEVEFAVPYKATTPYLKTSALGVNLLQSNGASPTYPALFDQTNGVVTVRVQNTLTGPAASPAIDILGYVSCAPDFQFAVPRDIDLRLTPADPTGVIQSEDQPIDGGSVTPDAKIAAVTFGESVASLRPLLHRTSLSTWQTLGSSSGLTPGIQETQNMYWRFPYGIGRNPNGYSQATISAATVPYHFATNHPIDWVLNAFVGVRGSTNIHFDVQANGIVVDSLFACREYTDPIVSPSGPTRNTSRAFANPNAAGTMQRLVTQQAGATVIASGQSGGSLTKPVTQGALSVSVPQYTNARFTLAFRNSRYNNIETSVEEFDCVGLRGSFYNGDTGIAAGTRYPTVSTYYSAGVDFQPIFYLCTPRLFVETNPQAVN